MKSLWFSLQFSLCIALGATAGCGYRGALQLPDTSAESPARPAEYVAPAAQQE